MRGSHETAVVLRRPEWASLLACPACRSPLPESLACSCGAQYSDVSGVPILRPEEAAPSLADAYVGLGRRIPDRWQPRAARILKFVRPQIVRRFGTPTYEPFVASFDEDAIIVNIGCGDRSYGRSSILNLDIVPGPIVDIVGVAEALPLRDEVVDGVILQAVLEHVADGERTLAEIFRVLRPGGRVMIDLPFIQGYHASPGDYRRYTEMGLRNELERHGFEVTGSGVAIGPASGMAWVTGDFLALLLSGRSKRLFLFACLLTRPLVWPLQWLDVALQEHPMAHVIASGVWAEARKPG